MSSPSRHLAPPEWHSVGFADPLLGPGREGALAASGLFVSSSNVWYALSRRRWTIFTVIVLLTAVAAAVSYWTRPVYRATARLTIEPETPLLQSLNDVYQRTDADDVFMQTQIQVLKSDNLAWQTIEQLDLAKSFGVFAPGVAPSKEEIESQKVRLIGEFGSNLRVETIPKTRMLSVAYESPDPKLAAQVVNAFVSNYLDYNFRQKEEAIHRSGWMDRQLNDLKANVEKSQQALVAYEQKNQIVSTGENQDVQGQMLGDLSRDLATAQSATIEKKSLYLQLLENRSEMATLAHDDLLQKLEERAAELKQEHTETAAQYGPNYPKAVRLQKQIEENQAEIEREQGRVLDRVRNDFVTASNRERLATAAVARQKGEVGKQNQLMVEHNLLKKEFETNQHLYQSLLERLKDATVTAGLRSTNIHLVDGALPPNVPVRPRKLLNIAVALSGGLMLGMICAYARDRLDPSVKTVGEAEVLTVTPALGVIPFARRLHGGIRQRTKLRRGRKLAITMTQYPNSPWSEAFRALGTAVSAPASAPKLLLVTSPQQGDGKTTTALNLAQALAERHGPVLIMDCDMRKGGVSQALSIRNDCGLSSVLAGERDISSVLQQCTSEPNLWVLPSGAVPDDPVRLLSSERFPALLKTISSRFEHVVIDSPPVLMVTDATILSTFAHGVLLVVASGATSRQGLVRTRRILATAGAKVIGVAVTNLNSSEPEYGYYGHA